MSLAAILEAAVACRLNGGNSQRLMPRPSQLDKQWQDLMSLCAKEAEFRAGKKHPKLLRFVSEQIDQLAAEMGFSSGQIKTREFRAERDGAHIVRPIIE
jgi:hypothetical protein